MASPVPFYVKKSSAYAMIPSQSSEGSAGYDVSCLKETIIEPGESKLIDTGISIQFPSDCYCRVAPRSGFALKFGIDVLAGVIDSNYLSPIAVILINHGKCVFTIKPGMRVAQLIFEKIYLPKMIEVEEFEKESTHAGFGSTGA
jgi:dUTP pyrophosphatase